MSQEHSSQTDLIQEDLVQTDLVQEDLVQTDLIQEDLVQEDSVQEDLIQEDSVQEHLINRKWILWYHDPNSSYSVESCDVIGHFNSVENFWRYYFQLKSSQLQNGMFFLTQDGYLPSWEENIDGGSWSFKIDKKEISQAWTKLAIHLVSEQLLENTDRALYDEIICLSISPKKTFSIFKIWVKDTSKKEEISFKNDLPYLKIDDAVYRTHKEIYEKELERKKAKELNQEPHSEKKHVAHTKSNQVKSN